MLRGLRAVRSFESSKVPREIVLGWLESARWTGSSKNSQPWRFTIVEDRTIQQALSLCGDDAQHLAIAPVVVVISSSPGPFPFSTALDLGRAVQSTMLAAASDGFGSCIAVFEPAERNEQAASLLGIPNGIRPELAVSGSAGRRVGLASKRSSSRCPQFIPEEDGPACRPPLSSPHRRRWMRLGSRHR